MPAVGLLAPEAGAPDEELLLDGAEHEQDETGRGKLGEDAERDADPAQNLGSAEESGESLAHADAPAPALEVLEMVPAAVREDQPHQQAHQQQPKIGESRQSWKHRQPPPRQRGAHEPAYRPLRRRSTGAGPAGSNLAPFLDRPPSLHPRRIG